MEQFKLRTYDGIAIIGFLTLPALFSTELSSLIDENNTAAWITLLISFAIMLCLFLISSRLMARYEGKNIIQVTSEVAGKPLGALYGVILGAYFCFRTGLHIRESAEVLKIYAFTLTPVYIISGLILLSAVIMNFFGGWPIIKTTGFFFIIMVFGIISVILLALNHYNPDNLVPVLGNGLPDIARNSLYTASLFDSVIVIFLFAPSFSKSADMRKAGVLSLVLSAAAYVLLCLCYIMIFSPSIASKMTSGFIEMGKTSYFNHFFYRFESALLFFLIFSAVVLASIGLLLAKSSFSRTSAPKTSKVVTLICAMPILAAVFLPANVFELTQKYLPAVRRYSVFFMAGFPILIFIISTIKRVFSDEKN